MNLAVLVKYFLRVTMLYNFIHDSGLLIQSTAWPFDEA